MKNALEVIDHILSDVNYKPIDWHSNFKSNYHWNPKTSHRDGCYGHVEGLDKECTGNCPRF